MHRRSPYSKTDPLRPLLLPALLVVVFLLVNRAFAPSTDESAPLVLLGWDSYFEVDPDVAWRDDLTPVTAGEWNQHLVFHLFERAAFGACPAEVQRLSGLSPERVVDELLDFGVSSDRGSLEFPDPRFFDLFPPPIFANVPDAYSYGLEAGGVYGVGVSEGRDPIPLQPMLDWIYAKKFANSRAVDQLRLWWAQRLLTSHRPLEERLVFFWHGHFANGAIKVEDYRKTKAQIELFRRFAAGSFRELLRGIIRDPSMMVYLDNVRNCRGRPVENLAREILELFALGRGNYTEADVKETARALTGWTLDPKDPLSAKFVADRFDDGVKTILGSTGEFDSDDLVEIILNHPSAASFIVGRIYEFFVGRVPGPKVLQELTEELRRSDFVIEPVLRRLFLSRDFYCRASRGTRIKGPVEWIISTYRKLGIDRIPVAPDFNLASSAMGQGLALPPSVAGWERGRAWINSESLAARRRFVRELLFPESEEGLGVDSHFTFFGLDRTQKDPSLAEPPFEAAKQLPRVEGPRYVLSRDDLRRGFSGRQARVVGQELACELVPERPISGTKGLSFVQLTREVGSRTVEEIVRHWTRRLLSYPPSPERLQILEDLLRSRVGDPLDEHDSRLEQGLRELVYAILCLSEYHLG